jgi:hypothetical protein
MYRLQGRIGTKLTGIDLILLPNPVHLPHIHKPNSAPFQYLEFSGYATRLTQFSGYGICHSDTDVTYPETVLMQQHILKIP